MSKVKIILNNISQIDLTGTSNIVPENIKENYNVLNQNGTLITGNKILTSLDDLVTQEHSDTIRLETTTDLYSRAFAGSKIKKFYGLNLTRIGYYAFCNCTELQEFYLAKETSVQNGVFYNCSKLKTYDFCHYIKNIYNQTFYNTGAVKMAFPRLTYIGSHTNIYNNPNLTTLDFNDPGGFPQACFRGNLKFDTLILRKNGIVTLNNANAFDGNTPFWTGGSGGTIYIPKALYDHLGDGTALDYKAATNWSTLDGYGTVTWAQIEGSYYETHYGDDTLIPTS